MSDKRQAGFDVVIVIIAVVVLVGLGIIGWRLYSSYSKPAAKTTTSSSQTSTSSSSQQQTDPNAGYVVIKEWGVRFKPVSGLSGVEYSSSNGFEFTTQQLSSLDPNCNGQVSGIPVLGNIARSTDSSVAHGPAPFAKVGDYYYYYYSPEATCSDQASVNAIQTSTIQLFKNSIVSFEASK